MNLPSKPDKERDIVLDTTRVIGKARTVDMKKEVLMAIRKATVTVASILLRPALPESIRAH